MTITDKKNRQTYVPPGAKAQSKNHEHGSSKKTLLLGLLCFGILLLAALPYAHGALANRINSEIIKSSNANNAYGSVEMTEHSRGYGSSTSTFKLNVTTNVAGFDAGEYEMKCNTKHKITGFYQSCNIAHPEYKNWQDENLDGEDPLTINMSGNLIGKFSSSAILEPFDYTDDEGAKISVGAAQVVTDLKSFNTKAFKFSGTADGVTMEDASDNVVIKGVTLSGDMETEGLFTFGFGDFLVEEISFKTPESIFNIENTKLNYQMPRSGKNLSVSYDLTSDNMIIQDQAGQSTTITEPGYSFEVGGINRDVAMELSQKYQQAMSTMSGSQQPDEEAMLAVFAETSENLEKLLAPGLFFTFDSSGKVEGELLQARFALKLDQAITREELTTAMFAPDQLLQKLNITINASVTDGFLATLENQETVQALKDSPYMMQNGNKQEFNVTSVNGVINLNGEEVPIEALLGAAASMVPSGAVTDPSGSVQSPMDFDPAKMGMEDLTEEEQQELMELIGQMQSE